MTSVSSINSYFLRINFNSISSLLSKIYNIAVAILKKICRPPAAYILKICIFRDMATQGFFGRWVIRPCARMVMNLWMKIQGIPRKFEAFNPERAKKAENFLSQFEIEHSYPVASYREYSASKFYEQVTSGLSLEESKWLSNDCKLLEPTNKYVILCMGFGDTIGAYKGLISYHLAAGFNVVSFKWREEISPQGFFDDLEAVYQILVKNKQIPPSNISTLSFCRTTFVATELQKNHAHEGLKTVLDHPPLSLNRAIQDQSIPSIFKQFGLLGSEAISGNLFDNQAHLQQIQQQTPKASTCLIESEGDTTVPQKTMNELKTALQQAGPCTIITKRYNPHAKGDPHFEVALRDPDVWAQYCAYVRA